MQVASMNPKDVDELLSQPFIKNQDLTVDELIKEYIGKLGEKIKVERFTRFSL
jgi:elongation factor Ts